MAALRRQLTRARAEALELAPDAFDALFDEPHTQLKVCHYPPLQAAAGERRRQRQRRRGALGLVLPQPPAAGRHRRLAGAAGLREWLDAPLVEGGRAEGSVVVNLGDMLQLASGGRLRAAAHRAVRDPEITPASALLLEFAAGRQRRSVALLAALVGDGSGDGRGAESCPCGPWAHRCSRFYATSR